MKRWSGLLLGLVFLCNVASHAAFGVTPEGRLDMHGIRRAYMESDFVPVRAALEAFMKRGYKQATRDEKVFAHIYLGVIYAADSIMDAKAESHFNALLEIAPNIELVDMFLPPKIQNQFDRVKRDYLRMKEYGRKYDALGNPLPAKDNMAGTGGSKPPPKNKPEVKSAGSNAWLWWTLGSAAVVGAGVGVYLLASSPDAPADNVTHVDPEL